MRSAPALDLLFPRRRKSAGRGPAIFELPVSIRPSKSKLGVALLMPFMTLVGLFLLNYGMSAASLTSIFKMALSRSGPRH